jgi:adenylate kinase family enzyme
LPHRYLIFGNSGAGKSTFARALAAQKNLAHLDLDPLAWLPSAPGAVPERRPVADAMAQIDAFVAREPRWVIEGCYADLIAPLLPRADALRFLNPPLEVCQAHCRARPWEPHKYPSPEAQDANLPMLLAWVASYETREGPLSLAAHRALFDAFDGDKRELTDPEDWSPS